jgi:Holliday junction DNA helicase RuvA
MIEHLRGTLLLSEPGHVVIECGGVGYGVEVPHSTQRDLPPVGSAVGLFIHTLMRESEITLCGFATPAERSLFLTLIEVQGIGPRMSLALLSALPAEDLVRAILEEDLALLTSLPGIGTKTAKRLVVELREPLRRLGLPVSAAAPTSEEEEGAFVPGVTREMREAAVAALIGLGAKPAVAVRAVSKAARVLAEEPSVEALVKEGLRHR